MCLEAVIDDMLRRYRDLRALYLQPHSDMLLDKLLEPQYLPTLVHVWNTKICLYSKNGLVWFNIEVLKACQNEP